MTCLIYQCEKTANHPFLACSINHGMKLKEILKGLKDFQSGELKIADLYRGKGIDISINEIEHYAQYA